MRLLLDTHTFLWFVADDPNLSPVAKALIEDPANEQLAALCQSKGVDLSQDKPKIEKNVQKKVDKLSKKSGDEFDKDYVSDMVDDHEKDVKEFEKASKEAQDPDLKSWASKTLPVIQDHLKMAKQIAAKLK